MRMRMRMPMPARSTVLQLGLALLVAGCDLSMVVGQEGPDPSGDDDGDGGSGSGGGSQDAPVVRLETTLGHYRGPCDGSGAVALDFKHFLSLSDEDQVARVYARGAASGPVQTFQLASALG